MFQDQVPPTGSRLPTNATVVFEVLALAVFGGTLGYFFSQHGFAGMARVRGLIPPLAGPWRYVPGQIYYELM